MVGSVALARMLGVTRQTIRNYEANGKFPRGSIVWLGRRPKYRLDLLEQAGWLRNVKEQA